MFVGRQKELDLLEDAYRSPKSELVVIYGRRRMGKFLDCFLLPTFSINPFRFLFLFHPTIRNR